MENNNNKPPSTKSSSKRDNKTSAEIEPTRTTIGKGFSKGRSGKTQSNAALIADSVQTFNLEKYESMSFAEIQARREAVRSRLDATAGAADEISRILRPPVLHWDSLLKEVVSGWNVRL